MASPQSTEPVYTAKMGLVTISAANSNLNGSGTLGTLIEGASNGTLIKTIIVKAQTDTSEGMIRLFVKKSAGSILLSEVYISPIIKSGRDVSSYVIIPLNYTLANGDLLKVSTQNADTFNIIAEAFDYTYSATVTFIGSSLQYKSNTGVGYVNVANPNLDGTGDMTKILEAGSSGSGNKGCAISSIVIKAQETTTPGIVRLFIQDSVGGTPVLFSEVIVPSVVQTATTKAFSFEVIAQGALCIPPGYSIWASTETDNVFSVVIESSDWSNA